MYDELVKALHDGAEFLEASTPGIKNSFAEMCHNAADAIEELSKPKWINAKDEENLPNTDSGVVGYFGGGAFNQLRWYDFVATLSDGTIVGESTERDVINEHCIAVYKLPEPPEEEGK